MYSDDIDVPDVQLKCDRYSAPNATSASLDLFDVELKSVLWLAAILMLWFLADAADSVVCLLTFRR